MMAIPYECCDWVFLVLLGTVCFIVGAFVGICLWILALETIDEKKEKEGEK